MLRFKLDVNFVHCKISFINIFPSLAILSHVDKTKNFKLTPNSSVLKQRFYICNI